LAGSKACRPKTREEAPLTTTFYSNEMVAIQSQNGLTNSYQLDRPVACAN
jgi:hypothetical protein